MPECKEEMRERGETSLPRSCPAHGISGCPSRLLPQPPEGGWQHYLSTSYPKPGEVAIFRLVKVTTPPLPPTYVLGTVEFSKDVFGRYHPSGVKALHENNQELFNSYQIIGWLPLPRWPFA